MRVRRTLAALLLPLGLGLTASGCGTFAQSYDPTGVDGLTIPTPSPRPQDFVGTVDNPWLSLAEGTRTYTVVRPGSPETTRTVEVLAGRVEVAGVATTAVRRTSGADVTTDYYAQDTRGNVWWFAHDGAVGAWRAGEGDAQPGLAMAASPRLRDGYRTAYVPGVVEDVATVVRLQKDTLEVDVTSSLAPRGVVRETYRRGVGLVMRVDAATGAYDELQP
ncbi:hypothetical protein SAMN04487968_110102 [Nocardioides terrae]|uniref:Lipoprotein n=1 Tax=Nocardioides terrae TaxID=574651 RepID=A0A1I1LR96_9ACTN|nr:hypothetical protein [Nocardioides terrae]SFC73458.1 hypothetical protein SAMN04487968_110102 [Nocardioides terrae]